jgi:hypothetical protein
VRLTTGRFVYAAVIADVFSRKIVGWAVADHLRTELPLAALRQAQWERRHVDLDGLIHHSDAGGQYVAVRYGEELATAGIVPSIGSVGDSFDNAMAKSTIGLVKTELVHNPTRGPWTRQSAFEFALAEYIEWFNNARLHGELGHRTPPRSRPTTTVTPSQHPWPESTDESLYRTHRGSEQLGGQSDPVVVTAATDEGRMLLTLDRGIADLRRCPPGSHAGIVVLRPAAQDPDAVLDLVERLVRAHPLTELRGCVVVVEPQRIRIRRPETDGSTAPHQ